MIVPLMVENRPLIENGLLAWRTAHLQPQNGRQRSELLDEEKRMSRRGQHRRNIGIGFQRRWGLRPMEYCEDNSVSASHNHS